MFIPHTLIRRTINPEDRSHWQTGIDVLRSIDGIEYRDVFSALEDVVVAVIAHDIGATARKGFFFGGHGADDVGGGAEGAEHEGVAEDVELLLDFSLDVGVGLLSYGLWLCC